MMLGYKNQPEKTREGYWIDPADGSTWQRMGDVGRVDADGFVELVGRTKDVIISGGFNIFPIDLEVELAKDARVVEAAVIGVPSEAWGETPVGFVVLKPGVGEGAAGRYPHGGQQPSRQDSAGLRASRDRRNAAQPHRQIAQDRAAGTGSRRMSAAPPRARPPVLTDALAKRLSRSGWSAWPTGSGGVLRLVASPEPRHRYGSSALYRTTRAF